MGFATAPAWLSVIFEPFSLFFLPGFAIDFCDPHSHDTRVLMVIQDCFLIYAAIFWLILEVRARVRNPRRRRRRS